MSHNQKAISLSLDTIERIEGTLNELFRDSQQGAALALRCARAKDEILALHTGRGLSLTPIAVIGSKNAGKSWICGLLVKDDATKQRIPCGETSDVSTKQATWIGPDVPPELNPDWEVYLRVPSDGMEDLGRGYVLLDLPGYDDAVIAGRESALRTVKGIPLRVVVCSSATMGIETQFSYLSASDGCRIVPVVIDNNYPQLNQRGTNDLQTLHEKIQIQCRNAEVEPPVVIPHATHNGRSVDENTNEARRVLLPLLKKVLNAPEISREVMENVVIHRLRREIASDLKEFVQGVAPAYWALVNEENAVAAKLVLRILGSDNQLEAGVRMKMRMFTLARTSLINFPYRTFVGVFSLTAGAWDRLAFALAGSVPSLALLAFQTARNITTLTQSRDKVRHALAERLEAMARDELAVRNEVLLRAINGRLPGGFCECSKNVVARTSFAGLSQVTAESQAIFEEVVQKHAVGKGLTRTLGTLASLAFWALAAGPVWSIYREYCGAWMKSLTAGGSWQAFPIPSGAMILATLLLIVLPTIVLALIAVAFSTPDDAVKLAIEDVKSDHDTLLARLSQGHTVRLVSDDPVREAVRATLDFVGAQPASSIPT